MRGAKTPTALPKGKTLADYDVPSQRGRASKPSKASPELLAHGLAILEGRKVIDVPPDRTQNNYRFAIHRWLARHGRKAKIPKIGDSTLYVKLLEEETE
jgi:hypothetical protein